mmetsp:Transcript_21239/g.50492  ORF Transcript_21239/g.50492 Transcript_21239/m.50492 type:complete len:221 (-) Transcript_21239:745-1407(-)
MIFTCPTRPNATADVKYVRNVQFTWKTLIKIEPKSTPHRVDDANSPNAIHQAGRLSSPPSKIHAKISPTEDDTISLIDVNSTAETVPPTRLSGRINSVHANRNVAKHSPKKTGEIRLIQIAYNGAATELNSSICHDKTTDPATQPTRHNISAGVTISPLMNHADNTVHTRSVLCNNKCVGAGTKCSPKFVTPYFRPNNPPIGKHHLTFHQKWGPKIHDFC